MAWRLAARLLWLLAAGNFDAVEREFHIKDAMEELQEELEDLSNRTEDLGTASGPQAPKTSAGRLGRTEEAL